MISTASATTITESTTTVGGTDGERCCSRLKVERNISENSSRSKDSGATAEDRSDKGIGSSEVDIELQVEDEQEEEEEEENEKEDKEPSPKKYFIEDNKEENIFRSLRPRLSQAKRQWSVQAVKGKVTTNCLWNACKALTIGIILIILGAGMATVGYFAEEANIQRQRNLTRLQNQPAEPTEMIYHRGLNNQSTSYWRPPQIVGSNVPRKTPSSSSNDPVQNSSPSMFSFGLNKLSYVGPIVMGIGGFVIVAACVMTFEARDSAAKIVPARFRSGFPDLPPSRQEDPRVRHCGAQTKWETLGVYGPELVRFQQEEELSRRAMTSAFIRFSRTIQSSMDSNAEYYDIRGIHRGNLVKCPSAPSLIREFHQEARRSIEAPRILRVSAFPRCANRRRLSTTTFPRQTMSVDNPAVKEVYTYPAFIGEKGDEDLELGASATGVHRVQSNESLALDLHLPQCAVTLSIRDSSRSPSGQATDQSEPSVTTPLLKSLSNLPLEEIAGPSGIQVNVIQKVDKQTSTSDHNNLSMAMWSRATGGGSFRETRRARANRKVKRSETIDTASSAHKKHHKSQRSRTGSFKNSNNDVRKMAPIRSDTARKHQLLRQTKIETTEVHDNIGKGAHAV